jgi:16S rRNA C1402 (ribose-2'-O) methylase RsmI
MPDLAATAACCRGSLQQVLQEFGPEGNRAVKGEIVLLVAGCTAEEQQYMTMSAAAAGGGVGPSFDSSDTSQQSREALVKQLVLKELALGKSVSATAKLLSQQLQIPRSKVYKLALELAGQQDQPEQS